MKRTLLLLAIALVGAQAASAQDVGATDEDMKELQELREWKKRSLLTKGYTNISYSMQRVIEPVSGIEISKADIGAAISRSRTFVLHRKPIAGMLFVGLDATWIDINYAQYGNNLLGIDVSDLTEGFKIHQADFGILGIGPSVHVLPVGKLGIHAYFKYIPTFATYFTVNDGFMLQGGYSSVFTTGGAVSWGFISLGAEARWGTGNYKTLHAEEEDYPDTGKLKTSGMRIYLSFRY